MNDQSLQFPTTHNGKPNPKKSDFFVPAPTEIGSILSAETTLRVGKDAGGFWKYWLRVIGICIAIAGGSALLDRSYPRGTFVMILILAFPFVSVLVGIYGRFIHQCSYVGEKGIARFTLENSRQSNPRSYVVLFDQVDYVIAKHAKRKTKYGSEISRRIRWKSLEGGSIVPLTMDRAGIDLTRQTRQNVAFLLASELAWNLFAWERMQEDFQHNSEYRFHIVDNHGNPSGQLIVSQSGIDVRRAQSEICLPIEKVRSFRLSDGVFTLTTCGQNLPKTIEIQYHELGNACFLSLVAETLLSGKELPAVPPMLRSIDA